MSKQTTLELECGITAVVDFQAHHPEPFWAFGFVTHDIDGFGSDEYQPCVCAGKEPMETLYQGIDRYHLPLPVDPTERQKFEAWRASRSPEPPRRADQNLDDPALDEFFADLAQMDANRAEAEERGIPDYDDMGFLRGYTPPTDPADL